MKLCPTCGHDRGRVRIGGRSCEQCCLDDAAISDQQYKLTYAVTQRMKDLHLEIARTAGVPGVVIAEVLAQATFGLGVTMMFESGYAPDRVVEIAQQLLDKLAAPATERGAS